MLGYFIDTSALAKRYHAEVGSQQMEMLAQTADNRLIVSQLSLADVDRPVDPRAASGSTTTTFDPLAARKLCAASQARPLRRMAS